jgi:hypothetical protein
MIESEMICNWLDAALVRITHKGEGISGKSAQKVAQIC